MALNLEIALKHLRSRVRQSVVAVLGVATGVGFSVAMAALMQGSLLDFQQKLIDASPHVLIKDEYRDPPLQPAERAFAGAVALDGLKPKEELRGIKRAKSLIAGLDTVPGLSAAPLLEGQVVIRFGGKDVAATLSGIDPERHIRVSQLADDMSTGTVTNLYAAANGVIAGDGLARKLGARIGNLLIVSSPAGVVLRMKLVGLFHTGVVAIDDARAYALLKKAQVLQDRPNVINRVRIAVPDIHQARGLARRLEERIGYLTESWDEANEDILNALQVRNVIMYVVVGAILLVAGFGIFNIVSTITYEKAHDIAILKSLGFRESDVRSIFVTEGLATGVGGSVLGWGLGFTLCKILESIEFNAKWAIEMEGLPIYYDPLHYGIATAIAVTSAGVAAFLPARRAARLNPVDIIRGAA
ncbi:MAG: ABC transporter permease [Alphaproteobacteria bacterium]|jgi:lipoprotein-releasing system permease protein|nr:ABC transporter permease [Alphaproteobacteria bacterium]